MVMLWSSFVYAYDIAPLILRNNLIRLTFKNQIKLQLNMYNVLPNKTKDRITIKVKKKQTKKQFADCSKAVLHLLIILLFMFV